MELSEAIMSKIKEQKMELRCKQYEYWVDFRFTLQPIESILWHTESLQQTKYSGQISAIKTTPL
jgi:hypothetical protein